MTIAHRRTIAPTRAMRALLLTVVTLALALPLQPSPTAHAAARLEPAAPMATIIVDTSADLDSGSITKTCGFTSGPFVAAVDGCTLRRAIVEASARPSADRPIAITFSLPPGEAGPLSTWTLPLDEPLLLDRRNTLETDGSVTIDGNTQPGGRSNGPKIIIQTNDNSLEIESENNVISNLAFKGGGVILLKVGADGNTIRDIWMGLSDDGQEIVFRTGQPIRMAGGGIDMRSDNNLIEENTISGAFAKAVNIQSEGENNVVRNNQIGTRADGTVPIVPPASKCIASLARDDASWYGGWGISLSGSNNKILNNRIAGLQNVRSTNDTPPMAIESFGLGHEISGNIIGVDSANNEVGVCGQGIKASSSNTQVVDNQVIGSRAGFEDDAMTAIMGSGGLPSFNTVTVRRNIVKDGPGNVYAFGPGVASALRNFNPAKITSINGTTVQGTAGDGSPCPNCLIDLYLDDSDAIGEALSYLGSATADPSGNFSFVMAQPLAAGTGIRTNSTTVAGGDIPGFGAGTTTKTSKLYMALTGLSVTGPITGEIGTTYSFTATVAPNGATIPIDYTVEATEQTVQTLNDSQSTTIVGTFDWDSAGVKTITVTAENELGSVVGTFNITLSDPRQAIQGVAIAGPTSGVVNSSYTYTFTVSPDNVTVPLDYTVSATDQSGRTLADSTSTVVSTSYVWTTPGTKTITVLVENEVGPLTNTLQVIITDSNPAGDVIFLPKLDK